ncbi:MAG TPA: MOSC domain-containing protein [Candidatus Riflebacteria bacterium]|nr:MOSC domain-containing protein [Candidatus Riflebacteria bacterium]
MEEVVNVVSLSKDSNHRFSKEVCESLIFLKGLGIEGDAHCGTTVKHRSRVKADPSQPSLRQVHLVHSELLAELQSSGFDVQPGTIGENVLTHGIDLLSLPKNTILTLGSKVVLRVTGLRNPCAQLDNYQSGLTKAVLDKDEDGNLVRKAGIMAVVEVGGVVTVGDSISIQLPPEPHEALEPV